jgi:archaeal flagellar protein FlaC
MADFQETVASIKKSLPPWLGGTPPDKKPEGGEALSPGTPSPAAPAEAGQIEIGVVSEPFFDNSQIEDFKKQMASSNERMADLESRLFKAEKAADNVRKENELLKGRMDQTDSRILDMLSVYEVVSNQINPFVGSSKVISSTMEQLQEEISSLKGQVSTMGSDLKILARGKVDIHRLVKSSVSDADVKRRVDLTKLIRTAVQSKKAVRAKKGSDSG